MYQFSGITTALLLLLAGVGNCVAQTASDTEAVRAANELYYAALSARDIRAMEQVWSQSPDDVNVAPPVRPVAHVGWTAVKKTYEIFWATLDDTVSSSNVAQKISYVFLTAVHPT